MQSTYQPLSLHEKAYLFFPNSKFSSIKKRKRNHSREKKDHASSITGKLNMTNTNVKN